MQKPKLDKYEDNNEDKLHWIKKRQKSLHKE